MPTLGAVSGADKDDEYDSKKNWEGYAVLNVYAVASARANVAMLCSRSQFYCEPSDTTSEQLKKQALALGSRCLPPLEEKKCLAMAAVAHIDKYSQLPWTRRKILHLLGVTANEQSQILEWTPRQKLCPSNCEKPTKERRALVMRAIQQLGPMSLSEMRTYLLILGYIASRETVSRDYAALGIVWKGKAGRRKKKEQKPLSLRWTPGLRQPEQSQSTVR